MSASSFPPSPLPTPDRVVGPRLRLALYGILGLAAALGVNSAYLASIAFFEQARETPTDGGCFHAYMVVAHLALGLLLVVPVLIFGVIHIRRAHDQPNRRAVRTGCVLFGTTMVLLLSGIALMWSGGVEIKAPPVRTPLYWAHVITPLLAVGLYILHRYAGSRIKVWRSAPTEIEDPAIGRLMNVVEP